MTLPPRCDIPEGTLKPRIVIRDIPCSCCGRLYGQTAYEIRRSITTGPQCKRAYTESRNPRKVIKRTGQKKRLEVVLPQTLTPCYDKKLDQWYMKVRVRKKNSDEPLVKDRLLLGIGANATFDQVNVAFKATYARMQLQGSSKDPIEVVKRKRKRINNIVTGVKSWERGRDKDLGISRGVIEKVIYKVHLPDPKIDGKKHYLGRYSTRAEARKVRNEAYKKFQENLMPCAVCGVMPSKRRGIVTHFAANCPNKVQLPTGVRPLLQAKLWNIVYSEGNVPDVGKLTQEDLYCAGYMHKAARGFRYFAREDVGFNFSLAKNYLKDRPAPWVRPDRSKPLFEDEDIGFE